MISFLLVVFILVSPSIQSEEYHEELYVKPLPSGHVNTYFQFTNRWKLGARDDLHHTHLFPLAIADILQQYNIKELHVSLTQGLWRYESWGYPVINSAPGAEVWAWFAGGENLTSEEVNVQWKDLVSTLSGLLCTSLNFIDKTNTVEPKYSFKPRFGTIANKADTSKLIRYAVLPREIVCTENLTPWKKLLPCNSKFGFTSLLNSGFVHNTNYHSLALSIRTLCDSICTEGCVIEFSQTANLVYDTKLLGTSDFSLRRLFGQGLNGACALSTSSKIYVDISDRNYQLTPEPEREFISTRGGSEIKYGEYDIKRQLPHQMFNIAWINKNPEIVHLLPPPLISAHRYILGHGQERGKIVTQLINSHWAPLNVILMENIPWYVPSYIHTLKIKCNGDELKPQMIHYVPGQQRERPYHLEIGLTIPAKSTVEVSFDFDYIFLKWLEYPPDANHGHYLGSAVLSVLLPIAKNYTGIPLEGYLFKHSFNASRPSYFLQIRTESLILSLPTPDFSMPYNVICLACTVVALAFGPIHSVATKKIVIEKSSGTNEKKSILGWLKAKLFKKKYKEESNDKEEKKDFIDEMKDMKEEKT